MKSYKILKCPWCSAESYDKYARRYRTVGASVFECPNCGKKSYRKGVLEPCMLNFNHFFALRFSRIYFAVRAVIIAIYISLAIAVYFKRDWMFSLYCLIIGLFIYIAYEVVRIIHKKIFRASPEYGLEIDASIDRLELSGYSDAIRLAQKLEQDSPYAAFLDSDNKEATEDSDFDANNGGNV